MYAFIDERARTTMRTDLVLDALEQALHDRLVDGQLVVYSDRGSPYVSMRDTGRLAAAGAAPRRRSGASATPMTMPSPRR